MTESNSTKLHKIHKRPRDDSDDADECKVCSAVKDEAKIKWLLESIEVNDLFRDLNPQQKRHIVLAMKLIEVKQNVIVLKQHSVIPQTVYVVEDGEFFAIIDGVRVRSWIKKGIFGELALLYDSPRAATIECVSDNGHLWELDRTTFQKLCEEYADSEEAEDDLAELDENMSVLLTSSAIHIQKRSSLRLVKQEIDLKSRSIRQQQKSREYKESDEVQRLFDAQQLSTNEKTQPDAMNCVQFKRIAYVLSKYQNGEMADDKYAYLNTKLGANYSNAHLCDDFYYVVNTHFNDYDFEIFYSILMSQYMKNKECEVEKCVMFKRNMRDRNEYEQNMQKYYGKDIEIRELMTIQLLDKMHCYFLHAYDQNHRLRTDEINEANMNSADVYDMSKVSNIIRGRRNREKARRTHHNKYNMENMDCEREQGEDEKEKDENIAPVYSFGVEFWYWNEDNLTQKEKQLVIAQKYKSLKEELLCNNIHVMKCRQFDVLNANATEMSKMKHVTETYVADWNNRGIKRGRVISEAHLICLMVYCNFDLLQRKFTETYRKINSYETFHEMGSRHSNFYHLGKYLYEAVNIYGKSIKDYKAAHFYHGISDEMMFASPKARIYGPLSTTISISVAIHFSDDDGLVLVLKGDEWQDNKYFDMSWISEFASESECFFIGGLLPMIFHNILNTKKGVNYKKYLPKFNILFTKIFNGVKHQFKSTKAEKEKKVMEKLINNRLSTWNEEERNEEYIFRLFDYYCNQRDYLSINYPYFQKEFDAFFDVQDMINLDEVMNVFPNIKHLKIEYLPLSQLFMQHLQDLIAKISTNQYVLQLIQLNWPTLNGHEIQKVLDPFDEKFKQFNFEIVYKEKEKKVFFQCKK